MTRKYVLPVLITIGVILLAAGYRLSGRPSQSPDSPPSDTVQPPAPETALRFDNDDVDLGEVGSSSEHSFSFVNASASAATITEIKPSCSCTVPDLKKRVYAPGERGSLGIKFVVNPNELSQHAYSVRLVAVSAEGVAETHRLQLRFHHVPDVAVGGPIRLQVCERMENSAVLSVVDYREKPFSIRNLRTSLPQLKAEIAEVPKVYNSGWKYKIRVTARGDGLRIGDRKESVEIETDDPKTPILRSEVMMEVTDRVRTVPSSLTLKRDNDTADIRRVFFLDDVAGETIEVESAKATSDKIQCEIQSLSFNRAKVSIRIASSDLKTLQFPVTVTVSLKKPVQRKIEVKVMLWSDSIVLSQ